MKKSAVIVPAIGALKPEINQSPRTISTTPLAKTTKSVSRGSQVGTCALKVSRAVLRCDVPAKAKATPRNILEIVLMIFIVVSSLLLVPRDAESLPRIVRFF